VKENVPVAPAATTMNELPPRVEEALGELVGAAKDGLLALSVGVGLGVLTELMEEEVDEVVGPKGKHDPDRTAVRHGHDAGEVTLGGRRVAVERPRARTADGESEVALGAYAHFADRDPLTRVVCEQMLAGVSTRRFQRTREPMRVDGAPRGAVRKESKDERLSTVSAGMPAPGPMQRPGEAGGSRGAGSRAGGGSSPDDVAAGWYCQTPERAQARPKRQSESKSGGAERTRGFSKLAIVASPRSLAGRSF
jgi:hypothetical protein